MAARPASVRVPATPVPAGVPGLPAPRGPRSRWPPRSAALRRPSLPQHPRSSCPVRCPCGTRRAQPAAPGRPGSGPRLPVQMRSSRARQRGRGALGLGSTWRPLLGPWPSSGHTASGWPRALTTVAGGGGRPGARLSGRAATVLRLHLHLHLAVVVARHGRGLYDPPRRLLLPAHCGLRPERPAACRTGAPARPAVLTRAPPPDPGRTRRACVLGAAGLPGRGRGRGPVAAIRLPAPSGVGSLPLSRCGSDRPSASDLAPPCARGSWTALPGRCQGLAPSSTAGCGALPSWPLSRHRRPCPASRSAPPDRHAGPARRSSHARSLPRPHRPRPPRRPTADRGLRRRRHDHRGVRGRDG
ncbi:MAG: hypothetical protein JWM64_2067 [Frankiales bacterium]|nr:hypothetical protein [Frankiales bacterium]